jgi:GxxExxY protein
VIYQDALAHELRKNGLPAVPRCNVAVRHDGITVGEYAADLLVEAAVLVKLKAVRAVYNMHNAQCLNYPKATGLCLCPLLNFVAPRLEIKRVVNAL